MKGWKSTGRIERGKYKTGSSSKRGERSDKKFSRYFKTVSRKKNRSIRCRITGNFCSGRTGLGIRSDRYGKGGVFRGRKHI